MKIILEKVKTVAARNFNVYGWVFLIYFITAKASLFVYATYSTSPTLIWPSVGIALAAIILYGYKMWIPIFLAQFLVVITETPEAYLFALTIATGYAIQSVISLYLLRKNGFDHTLPNVKHVLILICVAITANTIEPMIVAIYQMVGGTSILSPFLHHSHVWGAGIFSVLVCTFAILSWYPFNKKFIPGETKKRIEIFAAFTLLIFVNYYLFWTTFPQILGIMVIFLLPATLVWFALRFHPRWLSLAILISAIQSLAGSILAVPSKMQLDDQLLTNQIYIGLVASIFYVFATVVEERHIAYKKLEIAYETAFASDKAKNDFIGRYGRAQIIIKTRCL